MNPARNGCQHATFFLFLILFSVILILPFYSNSACAGGLRRYIHALLALGWVPYMSYSRCSSRGIKVMTYDSDATTR